MVAKVSEELPAKPKIDERNKQIYISENESIYDYDSTVSICSLAMFFVTDVDCEISFRTCLFYPMVDFKKYS